MGDDPTIPADVWALVRTMHQRWASTFSKDESGAREFMRVLIGQISFSFPGQGWCWKKSGTHHPESKDCLARQWEGRFGGWDLFLGAGVQGPTVLADNPAYHDLDGQVPVQVPARDVLGAAADSDDEHDEPDAAAPSGELAALRAEVAELRALLENSVKTLLLSTVQYGDTIGLRAAANGRWLCADLDQGARVIANREALQSWETFAVERA